MSVHSLPKPGPIIALIGSDGSGKSTVAAALLVWLRAQGPAELCHLGKQAGNVKRAIARWPLVGRPIDRVVDTKTQKARGPQGPGVLSSLVVSLFLQRRLRRFRRMLALRNRGVTILADRFPQRAVPGGMDGPNLGPALAGDSIVARLLARREQRAYAWMTSFVPTLVIRLNVDLATAVARKPDHKAAALAVKIDELQRLTFGGAPIVDIDATQPLAAVLAQTKQAIATAFTQRAGTGR